MRLALLALLALVPSCADEPTPDTSAQEAACLDAFRHQCAHRLECDGGALEAGYFDDMEGCLAMRLRFPHCQTWADKDIDWEGCKTAIDAVAAAAAECPWTAEDANTFSRVWMESCQP